MDPKDPRLAQALEANLKNWDERVVGHVAPDGYDIDLLVDDPSNLTDVVAFDQQVLSDVQGKTLLHAQCHIGTDTLSWAKLGATVTGFDFSPAAVDAARSIAARLAPSLAAPATFVEAEFYDSPNHIDAQFDIVYTSVGAICWLHDIDRWAETLASFLKPSGTFYVRDSHPALMALDDQRDDDQLVLKFPYFFDSEPLSFVEETSYAGSAVIENSTAFEWPHSLADVVNAVIGAGLTIERLEELDHLDWPFLKHMERTGRAHFLPDHQRRLLPLQFSIRATKSGPRTTVTE